MTIQTTAIASTSTNINVNQKPKTNPVEKIKEKYNSLDDGEKRICGALSGLAVLSLGGLGIALGLNKGKVNPSQLVNEAQTIVDNGAKAAAEVVEEVSQAVSTVKPQKSVVEIAQQASEQFEKGGNYAKIRRQAASNLDKKSKDVIKDQLAQVRAGRIKSEISNQINNANNNRSIVSSIGEITNANQGMKSAVNGDEIAARVSAAKSAAESAQKKAQEIADTAQAAPTRKNIKRARVAHNRAIKAQLEANKVELNGEKRTAQIAQDLAKKEENLKVTLHNTSAKRLEEGQRKMQENAQKTSERAIQRKAKRLMSTPGYQRALKKLQGCSKEKLQSVVTSPKSSAIEKTVAQDLLTGTV